jgi:hypothetical protein
VNLPAPPRSRAVPPLSVPAARPALLNWKPVALASVVAVLLIAGVLTWAVLNPTHRRAQASSAEEATLAALAEVSDTQPAPEQTEPAESAIPVGLAKPDAPSPAPAEAAALARADATVVPALVESAAPVCEKFGTSVEFDPNPERAARRAAESQRLLVILHISGNFEDSGFT